MNRHSTFRGSLAAAAAAALVGGVLIAPATSAHPTSELQQSPGETASQLRADAKKPLCRKGFVPVTGKRGYRCVRLHLPKVTSPAEYVRAVTVDGPSVTRGHSSKKESAALLRARRMTVAAMKAGVGRVRTLLADTGAPANAWAASDPTASFDTGQVCQNGTCTRTQGTVKTPGRGRVGRKEEVTVTTGVGPDYVSNTYRLEIALKPCPNTVGKVTGHITLGYEQLFFDDDGHGDTKNVWKWTTDADIAATVNGDARVEPYDLSGTWKRQITTGGYERKTTTDRMGFLDLRIPYGTVGPRPWRGTGPKEEWMFEEAGVSLEFLHSEVGPRLQRIEAEWRERKQCLNVITTPTDFGAIVSGDQRSIIVQAQAAADGKDVAAKLQASATGGTITPARGATRLGAPGRFTFTMGSAASARVTFTATSKRGVGERVMQVVSTQQALPRTLHGTVTYDMTQDTGSPPSHTRDQSTINVTLALSAETTLGVAQYDATGGTWQGNYEESGAGCRYSGSGSGSGVTGSVVYDWAGTNMNPKGWYSVNLAGVGFYEVSGSCDGYPQPTEGRGVTFGIRDQTSPSVEHLTGSQTITDPGHPGLTTVITWDLAGS